MAWPGWPPQAIAPPEVCLRRQYGAPDDPRKSNWYSTLWSMLAACEPPSEHLGLVIAIITLAKLHSTFVDNPAASRLVRIAALGSSKKIAGIRAALPRLPEGLRAVVPNLLGQSCCTILVLPDHPTEFDEVCSLSFNDETAARRELLRVEPKLMPVISISDDEFKVLFANLPGLPADISSDYRILLSDFAISQKNHPDLRDNFRLVWDLKSYKDWFAIYNAHLFRGVDQVR